MKKKVLIGGVVIAGALLSLGAQADTLFVHANGYTFDAAKQLRRFDAMLINDAGKIVKTGPLAHLQKQFPKATQIDLEGKTVLPGLIDAHGHVLSLGMAANRLSLRPTQNLNEALTAISNYAAQAPHLKWIQGGEWNQAIWKLGRFPTAQELDSAVLDRPVWLRRVDGHAGWANSKALSLAGINAQTADPAGGKIERDAQGVATGILVDAAMDLMEKVVPAPDAAEMRFALDGALKELRRLGLTSVHDAGVTAYADQLFREYARAGQLSTRIYGMIGGVDFFFDQMAAQGASTTSYDDRYTLRAVKLYSDGALGSRGAALLAPYSDAPHTKGLLFLSDQDMQAQIKKAALKGYQVNVHAIGDAGNRQVLEAFAQLPKEANAHMLRHRIEHAQVLAVEDIPKLKQLQIIPSMQPTHATSDLNMAEDRVGKKRIAGAYAWRRFLKQGSAIACGSDFPIENPNPFWGIDAAVNRWDFNQAQPQSWYPEQAMTVQEALRCFTLDAAYAAHQEKVLGSLEPGKWADFVVIDRDIFKIPRAQLHQTTVLQTWVAGKQVFVK